MLIHFWLCVWPQLFLVMLAVALVASVGLAGRALVIMTRRESHTLAICLPLLATTRTLFTDVGDESLVGMGDRAHVLGRAHAVPSICRAQHVALGPHHPREGHGHHRMRGRRDVASLGLPAPAGEEEGQHVYKGPLEWRVACQ